MTHSYKRDMIRYSLV